MITRLDALSVNTWFSMGSISFFFFLVFVRYFLRLIHTSQVQLIFLSFCSFCFLGAQDWLALALLLASTLTLVLYEKSKREKPLLWVFIGLEIGGLGFFKLQSQDLVLPLGMSFFVFQSIAAKVDLKKSKVSYRVDELTAFLSFFPQLISGPICRLADLLPQLQKTPLADRGGEKQGASFRSDLDIAFVLLAEGLFRKFIIADGLAEFVNNAFNDPARIPNADYWLLVVLCFSIQIYFDFYGYCLIALGAARSLGIRLPQNFNYPYFASGLKDFWSRWNITLSQWFRDYVYIPLGGRKKFVVIILTFLLSALWHGVGFGYFLWGILHAIGYYLETHLFKSKLIKLVMSVFVIHIGWIFFRSETYDVTYIVLKNLLGLNGYNSSLSLFKSFSHIFVILSFAVVFEFVMYLFRNTGQKLHSARLVFAAVGVIIVLLFGQVNSGFIYYRF